MWMSGRESHNFNSQSCLENFFIQKKTFSGDVLFICDGGVVEDIGDVSAVDIGLVGFDDDEGDFFQFFFDKLFGLLAGILGIIWGAINHARTGGFIRHFCRVDATEADALADPNIETEVDPDQQRIAVDDFFNHGCVEAECFFRTFEDFGGLFRSRCGGW